MFDQGLLPGVESADEAEQNMVKAMGKGILKTISKMGISTVRSYCGAQIFEAVGLEHGPDRPVLHAARRRASAASASTCSRSRRSPGTARAYPRDRRAPAGRRRPPWRRDGEHHQWNPETIAHVQHAVRHGGAGDLRGVLAAGQRRVARAKATLRGLLKISDGAEAAIPIEEVEPAKEIVKRFATGAMSLGSISPRRTRRSRSR